ncbi:MAG: hypothetical protein GY854_31340 [Deltaproteobacteria bacterium]|nr:hypothetical protein [Deltaproteobacteria bacterium]
MTESCPKCAAPKTGESCPKCGLVFTKFKEAILTEGVPEEISNLWKAVEDEWEERSRHAVFVERALAAGAGGYAAACYRRHEGDPEAEERLDQIDKRLEQMLGTVASQPRDRSRSRLVGAVALIVLLLGVTMLFLLLYSPMAE